MKHRMKRAVGIAGGLLMSVVLLCGRPVQAEAAEITQEVTVSTGALVSEDDTEYVIRLVPQEDDYPAPVEKDLHLDRNDSGTFRITTDKEGTFVYRCFEVKGSVYGVRYAQNAYTVTLYTNKNVTTGELEYGVTVVEEGGTAKTDTLRFAHAKARTANASDTDEDAEQNPSNPGSSDSSSGTDTPSGNNDSNNPANPSNTGDNGTDSSKNPSVPGNNGTDNSKNPSGASDDGQVNPGEAGENQTGGGKKITSGSRKKQNSAAGATTTTLRSKNAETGDTSSILKQVLLLSGSLIVLVILRIRQKHQKR